MEIVTIAVIGVIGALVSLIIKQYKPEYAIFASMAAGVLIFSLVASRLSASVSGIRSLFAGAESYEYLALMLKALGICILAQLAADTCRDVGEGALATKIELGGKVLILFLTLPLFKNVIEMIASVIG